MVTIRENKTQNSTLTELNRTIETVNNKEGYINVTSESTGASFAKDFLCVNLDNKFGPANKAAYFYKPVNDTSWSGLPPSIRESTEWIGYREVFYVSNIHVIVHIIEAYPICGRDWTSFFNVSGWSGWRCTSPKLDYFIP